MSSASAAASDSSTSASSGPGTGPCSSSRNGNAQAGAGRFSDARLRFVTWPGVVLSDDGDAHEISHQRLIELFGVPPSARVVVGGMQGFRRCVGDVDLRPSSIGDYDLVSAIVEQIGGV